MFNPKQNSVHSNLDFVVVTEVYKCLRGNKDNFTDFTVNIGDFQFNCHKFVLSSCSGFFEALMRTDMREKSESSCTIEGISPEIFGLILDFIYEGRNVLNDDNILAIWHASNQLQITFLVLLCEHFVKERVNLQNYWDILLTAQLLDSLDVINRVRLFMVKNVQKILESDAFVQLSFDDFKYILNHCRYQYYRTDFFVQSVLKWTCSDDDYLTDEPKKCSSMIHSPETGTDSLKLKCRKVNSTTDERGDLTSRRSYLGQLLALISLQRTSNECLAKLMNNKFVIQNVQAMTIVNKIAATRFGPTKFGPTKFGPTKLGTTKFGATKSETIIQPSTSISHSSESSSEDESDETPGSTSISDYNFNVIRDLFQSLTNSHDQPTIQHSNRSSDLFSENCLIFVLNICMVVCFACALVLLYLLICEIM
ncbi:kelch-like protein 18 [Physella acuta]|uniref:kelch-like protein 18 n=1 Tax=Physella acuta TaxID=109671 RepID=UPI0027DE8C37|nr:kelch-like protein 18 [Physella acuta]XP_059139074.1 kelch-like protein 18 [Physella acuta]